MPISGLVPVMREWFADISMFCCSTPPLTPSFCYDTSTFTPFKFVFATCSLTSFAFFHSSVLMPLSLHRTPSHRHRQTPNASKKRSCSSRKKTSAESFSNPTKRTYISGKDGSLVRVGHRMREGCSRSRSSCQIIIRESWVGGVILVLAEVRKRATFTSLGAPLENR